MANRRKLKHVINQICDELFVEAVAASLYGNDNHEADAEALLYTIIKTQSDFIARVSHSEPGIKPHVYFNKLREDFSAQVSDIVDHINNM